MIAASRAGKLLLAVLALGLTVSACGGDERGAVATAADKFFTAFADADSAALCAQVSSESLQALGQGSSSCQSGFATLFARADPATLEEARNLPIDQSKIVVDGNTATIPPDAANFPGDTPGGSNQQGLTLVKENGVWKVQLTQ